MVKGKPPAFQMYAADFLTDTAGWTVDEIGIYLRLLLHEWINETLENDPRRLARIAGCSQKRFLKGWTIIEKKFIQNGEGLLINEKLEEVRREQDEYRKAQSEAGLRGIKAKKKKGVFPFNK